MKPGEAQGDTKPQMPSRQVYAAISTLAGLGLLEAFSFGIVVPLLPIVTTEYFARQYTPGSVPINCGRHSHDQACIDGSKDADWWSGMISAVGSICFFMISATLGIASDYYGRKPFVVASQILRLGTPFAIIYFVEYAGPIWPYFVLRFMCNVFETMGVTSAAVADIVSAENRATAFGFLFAIWSIGFCVAAGVAGFFSRSQALRASALLCINRVLFAAFVFPETLPPEKRTRRSKRRTQLFKNPITGMSILFRSSLFIRLTMMIALTSFVSSGIMQIRMFYLNTVIGFDEKDTSRLMLTFGIGSILAQLLFLKPLMSCGKERSVIVVALTGRILESAGYVVSAFVPEKWVIYATAAPSSIGDLSFAAISSLKSINCSEKEQGRLQGAIYGARSIFEAIGPVVFAYIYNMMREDAKWTQVLPFALSIVLYALGAGVAMLLPRSSGTAPPIPFSPMSSAASSPLAATSATSSFAYDYDADADPRRADEDDENVYLAEPLLGNNTAHGVGEV